MHTLVLPSHERALSAERAGPALGAEEAAEAVEQNLQLGRLAEAWRVAEPLDSPALCTKARAFLFLSFSPFL